jgi:hypothetical protein
VSEGFSSYKVHYCYVARDRYFSEANCFIKVVFYRDDMLRILTYFTMQSAFFFEALLEKIVNCRRRDFEYIFGV